MIYVVVILFYVEIIEHESIWQFLSSFEKCSIFWV